MLCRCEGVTRSRLEAAIAQGHDNLDGIKRNTRAGMGWCGGRTCLAHIAGFLSDSDEAPAAMRARPPARPIALGALVEESDS